VESILVQVPSALDAESVSRFRAAIATVTSDGEADGRVVLLRGAPGVFCRGMRLLPSSNGEDEKRALADFCRCLVAIRFASCPVLAVVDGEALAGGVGVAAACDVVLATPRSSFALSEVLFGLTPAAIFPLVVERVLVQKAKLMALCGTSYSAAEAHALGLVDALAPEGDLDGTIKRWVRLVARGESGAVGRLKRLSSGASRSELEDAIERGAAETLRALATPAVRARISAFEAGDVGWSGELA